ncbi:MAG: ribbon-helix-helix domain-containing protein [Candidatus Methanomethyliaceae archaeon]
MVGVFFKEEMAKELEEICKMARLSKSAFIRMSIINELERQGYITPDKAKLLIGGNNLAFDTIRN